jgi:hypothetical protein
MRQRVNVVKQKLLFRERERHPSSSIVHRLKNVATKMAREADKDLISSVEFCLAEFEFGFSSA